MHRDGPTVVAHRDLAQLSYCRVDLNRLKVKYQSNYKSSNDKWVSS